MKILILLSLLFIIVSYGLTVNARIGIEAEEIIGEFLVDIPRKIQAGLISNSYRTPGGEILTTFSNQGKQWSLAVIFAEGERVGDAASLMAARGLFQQKLVRDLSDTEYTEDIKNDLAYYFLAHQTNYSIENIEKKKTMENKGMTAVLISSPINALNYQVSSFEIDQNFYQYLIFKSEFLYQNNKIDRAISRFRLIESETDNKNFQLAALIKMAKIYSEIGSKNNVIESLNKILSYEDINLYRAYGPSEFKELVRLLVSYDLKQKSIETAAFALALFPEETYFEELILSR